ncbi:MAG: hypothetical protein ACR2J8_06585 [Thermomicrobiales bacterium]
MADGGNGPSHGGNARHDGKANGKHKKTDAQAASKRNRGEGCRNAKDAAANQK